MFIYFSLPSTFIYLLICDLFNDDTSSLLTYSMEQSPS
jgi:hypothetical protein